MSHDPVDCSVIVKSADLRDALDRARAGDEQGIALVYRSLQPSLLRYLRHEAPDAAEDLASETWLGVAKGLPGFVGGNDEFRAWVFTIARRRVADHYRTQARRPRLVSMNGQTDDPQGPDAADIVISRLTDQEAVEALVGGLVPEQAEVMLLRVVAGLSVEQVAAMLGRSAGAVRMLQHRAVQKLQKISIRP